MKKKILIALLIIILLLAGGFIYLLMNLNSLVSQYKPEIEKKASEIMQAPVTFSALDTSLFPNTRINLKGLNVGGNQSAFKLAGLSLHVNPWALISKELEITTLSLEQPEVTVAKTAAGIEISGLPKKAPSPAPEAVREATRDDATIKGEKKAKTSSPLDIMLKAIRVNDARIILKGFMPDKDVTINDLDVFAKLSLSGDLVQLSGLEITASLFGKSPLSVNAEKASFNLGSGDLSLPSLSLALGQQTMNLSVDFNLQSGRAKITLDGQPLQIQQLISYFEEVLPPVVSSFNAKGAVEPEFVINKSGESLSIEGTLNLAGIEALIANLKIDQLNGTISVNGNQKSQKITSENLKLNLNQQPLGLKFQSAITLPEIGLSSLTLSGFSGNLSADGRLALGTPPKFAVNSDINQMSIDQMVAALKPDLASMIGGKIDKIVASLSGTLGERLKQDLNGKISLTLSDATLKGFNIGALALKAARNIPLTTGSLYDKVSDNKKQLFDVADTDVQKLTGNLTISGGYILTDDLYMLTKAYELRAKGKVGMDASLNLTADITFTPDISQSLVSSIKELKGALDSQGRLTIPLAISGTPPAVIVTPNLSKLLEMGAKSLIKEKAGELLGKSLKEKGGKDVSDLIDSFGF